MDAPPFFLAFQQMRTPACRDTTQWLASFYGTFTVRSRLENLDVARREYQERTGQEIYLRKPWRSGPRRPTPAFIRRESYPLPCALPSGFQGHHKLPFQSNLTTRILHTSGLTARRLIARNDLL